MKRTLTSISLAMLFAGLMFMVSSSVMAQADDQAQSSVIKEAFAPETQTCQSTYAVGAGATKFAFCVTQNGNVLNLESPATYITNYREGYVVCGTGAANAYDSADAGAGWGSSTITQPNGANTFPLTITRNSLDGKFQLKQVFSRDAAEFDITITMTLTNISTGSISNIKLARYFDGDIDNDDSDDIYDRSAESSWGRETHAVSLTALTPAIAHSTAVETYGNWLNTRSACTPTSATVPTAVGDYTGRVTYTIGTLNAGASKTVKFLYRRF
ncbi:MAG TPA: hypothetical protein VF708_10040 [Pyrinomonadaceae bacterium]|jgi:hypothetical protein